MDIQIDKCTNLFIFLKNYDYLYIRSSLCTMKSAPPHCQQSTQHEKMMANSPKKTPQYLILAYQTNSHSCYQNSKWTLVIIHFLCLYPNMGV